MRARPARNPTVSKKLRDRAGACEPVQHGDGERVGVSERDALAVFAPQGKKPRSCGDLPLSEWGGTRCGTSRPARHPAADPGRAFRDCDVRAAATSPARRPRGGVRPDAGLTSSLGNRGGRAWGVRASGGPRQACHRLPSGRAAFQELVLIVVTLSKTS